MIADYHMHLRNEAEEVTHRFDAIEPFVEAARAAGVDEIGFSEHVYYFRQTRPLWTVPYHTDRCVYDIEQYVDAVLEGKRHGLPVKLAVEVDYVSGREAETRDFLAPYPWDYLLGSIHYVDGLGIDAAPRLTDAVGVDAAWTQYFDMLGSAARSGLFDALSHPDLVKIFGERADAALQADLYEAAAEAMADSDVAVEVSTAGLRKPVGEMYPAPDFLRACGERGVAVTTASDAHVPSLVGHDFRRARELLRDCGYETTTFFDGRTARQVPLDA